MIARIAKFFALAALFAVLAIAVLAGGLTGFLVWRDYRFSSHSPVAANLPANFELASAEFRARILARFPVGTPRTHLIQDLESQDFKLLSPGACPDIQSCSRTYDWFDGATGRLSLDRPSLPCRLLWNVVWRANADGAITAIRAEYHAVCL